MTIFTGLKGKVWMNGKLLDPAPATRWLPGLPDYFCWGEYEADKAAYCGADLAYDSGAECLALRILLEYASETLALCMYKHFMREVILSLPSEFTLSTKEIEEWIECNSYSLPYET